MNLVGGIALFFVLVVVIYFIWLSGPLTQFASLFDSTYRPTHRPIIAQNVRRNDEERAPGIRMMRNKRSEELDRSAEQRAAQTKAELSVNRIFNAGVNG
jgi:hypothetical protein